MSALILTFVSDCTQQHHKSSYVSSTFPFFLPRLQSTHFSLLLDQCTLTALPSAPFGPPGQCIAAFTVSGEREGREPLVTIGAGNQFREFALRQTHLQGRLETGCLPSLMLVGTLASGTFCTVQPTRCLGLS